MDLGFEWVHLIDPHESEMVEAAAGRVHPLALADVTQGVQLPKIEQFDGHLSVNVWDVRRTAAIGAVQLSTLAIFVGEDWLITVQQGPSTRDLAVVLRRDGPLEPSTPLRALYRILAAVVEDYAGEATAIEDELDLVEQEVFDEEIREDYQRIYRLRRRIGMLDRAASSLSTAMEGGRAALDALLVEDAVLQPYLQHLKNDVRGAADLADDQHKALDAVVSSHESNVSTRQNEDMRTIAAVAALLAIPTVVAGIYGMNFKDMPLLHMPQGWLVVLGIAAALDVGAWVWFRLRGWVR